MNVYALSAKNCMSHLLLRDTFDHFSFIEGDVTTFNHFHIDGFLQPEFFDEAPAQTHSAWKDVREYFLSVVRGTRTPLRFKIVLSLAPSQFGEFLTRQGVTACQPEDIQGLYLNFRYDGRNLQCVTGTSFHTFQMDKTLDHAWDAYTQTWMTGLDLLE